MVDALAPMEAVTETVTADTEGCPEGVWTDDTLNDAVRLLMGDPVTAGEALMPADVLTLGLTLDAREAV